MSKYLFFLGSSFLASAAAAQDTPPDPGEQALEEIIAAQEPEPEPAPPIADQPQPAGEPYRAADPATPSITVTATGLGTDIRNTGQPVTIIDRAEIEAVQGADIARVLRRAPGVSISRNGPIGSVTGIRLRGAEAEQLLVLIDGVRVADQASPAGGFDFGNLLLGSVRKIDLLRGSNSTIWGSDAIGGVLDVSTRGTSGLAASLEYGARDTLAASAAGGVEGDGYFAGLSAGWFRSDGFSAAAAGTERDGFEQLALGGSAFVDLTPSLEFFVNGRYAEGDLEIDGFPAPSFALADTLETQQTEQFSGAAGLAYYGNDLTLRGAWSIADTMRTNFDPALGSDPLFVSDGQSQRLSLRGEYRLIGGLALAFGGEHEWSDYATSYDSGAEAQITGGYVQAGWVMGNLAAHAGVRLDDHSLFGTETSFGGDLSYGLGGGWRLRASAGEGFKAPTLFQLYSDFGNRALQPEKSTSMDIGFERGQRGSGWHFALTAFRRDAENLIAFDNSSLTYANILDTRAQGIEVEAGFDIADGLRLAGAYSFVDTEDRASGSDLARRPRNFATLFADYETPFGLVLGADLRLSDGSYDDAANAVRLRAYEVLDLRAALPVTDGFELFGRVENVFDEEYQTAAGYASAGRGAFVGIRAQM